MIVYSWADGAIASAEPEEGTFADGVLDCQSGDDDLPGADGELETDDTLWDAISARQRYVRSRTVIDGEEVPRLASAEVDQVLDSSLSPTLSFESIGKEWALPALRSWGSKPADFYLAFGKNSRRMREVLVFSGFTFQKENAGAVSIDAKLTCVDRSVRIAGTPICYSLPAWAGKRMGEIVREIIALNSELELSDDMVHVPVGPVVHKAVILNNANLYAFVEEFGQCQNWFPFSTPDGHFHVEKIELKRPRFRPDWTLDARAGAYDMRGIDEKPPSRPPCRYYLTGEQPVPNFGPEGLPAVSTTWQKSELYAPYNPQCVKVRPSGLPSFLQADGSYRALEFERLMLVERVLTGTTLSAGDEILKVTRTFRFYNPAAYDPNYDSDPAGTDYDLAYGDKSFHRDEVESLMEVTREVTQTFRDPNGTARRQVSRMLGWKAPLHALNFTNPTDREGIVNGGGGYVFGGGTMRSVQQETFRKVSAVNSNYLYGPDGTQVGQEDLEYGWDAPIGACDVVQIDGTPIAGVGGGPSRLGGFPEPLPPGWHPGIGGPYYVPPDLWAQSVWLFAVTMENVPTDATRVAVEFNLSEVRIVRSTPSGNLEPDGTYSTALAFGFHLGTGEPDWPMTSFNHMYFRLAGNTKPPDYLHCYARAAATIIGGSQAGVYYSAKLIFDPFQNVPVGGRI